MMKELPLWPYVGMSLVYIRQATLADCLDLKWAQIEVSWGTRSESPWKDWWSWSRYRSGGFQRTPGPLRQDSWSWNKQIRESWGVMH